MKKYGNLLVLVLLLAITSCNEEEILKETPRDFYTVDNGYTSPEKIVFALTTCYARVRASYNGAGNYVNMMIGTDVTTGRNGNEVFGGNTDLNVNTGTGWWRDMYDLISLANTILDRIDAIDYPSEELKNEHKAEARMFRAFGYRSLANLYGGVPLELNEVTSPKRDYVRATRDEVYNQCVEDLSFAAKYLPDADNVAKEGRVPKGAANHLLSEVYISLKEWDKAIAAASEVIDGGEYNLMTERFGRRADVPDKDPYWDLFQRGSMNRSTGNREGIWVLQFAYDVPGGSQAEYYNANFLYERTWGTVYWFYPRDPDGKRFYHIWYDQFGRPGDTGLLTNFIKEDIWKSDWSNDIRNHPDNLFRDWEVINPESAYFGKKLSDFDKSTLPVPVDTARAFQPMFMKITTPNDHPKDLITDEETGELYSYAGGTFHAWYKMRLAETYLLRAEAYLGKGDKTSAAADINMVRARAQADPVAPADVDIDYILDERARELYLEEPRRMTLSRLGLVYDRVREHNPDIADVVKPYWNLLPIPFSVIEVNTEAELTQNPGYSN